MWGKYGRAFLSSNDIGFHYLFCKGVKFVVIYLYSWFFSRVFGKAQTHNLLHHASEQLFICLFIAGN